MEYKKFSNGLKIPVLGLGTWRIGGDGNSPDYSKDQESITAIVEAVKLGYTHIDTAEQYGAGHCEELVGEAIKGFDREKLFITTKVMSKNLQYDDVIRSCKKSLERLQTSYIDLYLIHAPNKDISLEETMKAMDHLLDINLVKFIGVSNFNVETLKEAQKYSKHKIVANQIEYSLMTRNKGRYGDSIDMESETIPYCQKHDIIIMAERPIERGALLKPNPVLDALAENYGKTKAQIAINWLISKPNIITIPKSSDVNHLKENLGAIGWKLTEEDLATLDSMEFI